MIELAGCAQLQVISDYSDVSGLLLSSVCTGYQLQGAEKRMHLHNALEIGRKNGVAAMLLPSEKLKGIDPEVREYILTLELKLKVTSNLSLFSDELPKLEDALLLLACVSRVLNIGYKVSVL